MSKLTKADNKFWKRWEVQDKRNLLSAKWCCECIFILVNQKMNEGKSYNTIQTSMRLKRCCPFSCCFSKVTPVSGFRGLISCSAAPGLRENLNSVTHSPAHLAAQFVTRGWWNLGELTRNKSLSWKGSRGIVHLSFFPPLSSSAAHRKY